MNYYLGMDCETGGTDENTSDLLTAYFCIIDEDYKILDEIDLKLKPDNRLILAEAGALKVNGINIQAHMGDENTIRYCDGKIKLVSMLRKYLKKNGRWSNIKAFGYNVGFDIKYVQKYLLPKEDWDKIIHYKKVDVMEAVDFLKRAQYFPKEVGTLSSVVEYLEIPKRNAHTAKDDVLMTIEVDRKIMEIMAAKKDGGQAVDLISLLEAE